MATAALILLPLAASAAEVCFFEHYNYQGASHCTSAVSGEVGAAVTDRISSVRVPAGTRVTLYQHPGFTGTSLQLTADTPNLADRGFNNLTSSFKVAATPPPPAAGPVCFYEDYDFRGQSECISATGGDIQVLADRVSSVKVPAGVKLSLYENGGASGRMLVLSADAPNLAMAGFNNRTSSFRSESTGTGALQVVFIGNSFTHGNANPVLHYNSANVTDLNGSGYGGMPGLFKQLTVEAGLNYQVAIEAVSAQTLKFHYTSKRAVLDNQRWDAVVMQDQSNLDPAAPGNPASLITYSGLLEKFIHGVDVNANANGNAKANVWLLATWPRPDQVYQPGGHWYGQTLEQAAAVLSNGYKAAATQNRGTAGMIPVGDAFVRAVGQGVADRNPYDGIDGDKLNLWSGDNHHASAAGSYLEALMAFARLTGRDPRSLGAGSVAARAMNLTAAQTTALQEVAYRQLLASQAP
ncbi:beta/gamma crystallin-related protein [Roseateles chitinivorans]|uniref:beta/gamma crystallin-related protein n=1 Tax=Roseateles chitinivorans TaxID=2917965 RepID=UPI003D665401